MARPRGAAWGTRLGGRVARRGIGWVVDVVADECGYRVTENWVRGWVAGGRTM